MRDPAGSPSSFLCLLVIVRGQDGCPGQSSGFTRWRRRLASARRRFAARRRSRAALEGLVFLRGFRGLRASETIALRRSIAASRFRSWLRRRDATTRSQPRASIRCPSFSSNRSRCVAERVGLVRTFQRTSTRVADVFTCWPPGPPDRDARISSSSSGMVNVINVQDTPWTAPAPMTGIWRCPRSAFERVDER